MNCLVKDGECTRRIATADNPFQIFACFQTRTAGLVNGDLMERFLMGLKQPLSVSLRAPIKILVFGKEPLDCGNWCLTCEQMQRSAACLFEISDADPNVFLLMGIAVSVGKPCAILKKRNSRVRMNTEIGALEPRVYEDLDDPAYRDDLITFLAQKIRPGEKKTKTRRFDHPSLARFVRYLREKQGLMTKQVLRSDEIVAGHQRKSVEIDLTFKQSRRFGTRARILAQRQLDEETQSLLDLNHSDISAKIAEIDCKISELTEKGLAVSDGINNYLVVQGVKLKIPDTETFNYPALGQNRPVDIDLLGLLENGKSPQARKIGELLVSRDAPLLPTKKTT